MNYNIKSIDVVKRTNNILLTFFSILLATTGCKKLAETPAPTGQVAENAVYSSDGTAIAVMTGLYNAMNSTPAQGSLISNVGSITLNAGLAADEFSLTTPFITGSSIYLKYFQNDLSQANGTAIFGAEHWAPFYNFIFKCNAAIEGLNTPEADGVTTKVKIQLLGEAKFMRAFWYFYLVNEFGNVPLVLSTDAEINTNLPRADKNEVYKQMIIDLLDAEGLLNDNYLDGTLLNSTSERVRPTKWAAAALLARVYLYTGDYAKAEEHATFVLNNTTLFGPLPKLNDVFSKNSREAIWQIQPTALNFNTRDGQTFIIPATGPSNGGVANNPVFLSKQLLKSFESNDQRAKYGNWIDTTIYRLSSAPAVNDTMPHAYKYKINASAGVTTVAGLKEYFMVLRLAEQYLIRAEARVQLGNFGDAQTDLNAVRNRAGLSNITAADKTSLLSAILHERQVELFAEWGHRWFDLKRTGNVDAVMSIVTPLKANGAPWRSFQQWFPIPIKDIQASTNLDQNDGY